MKTRELIRRLQESDPEGDLECVVGGTDIYFVERLPGYYDGAYEVLIHDDAKRDKAFSIVGAKETTVGEKIRIHTYSIENMLYDHPNLPVTCEYTNADPNQKAERERRFHAWADGIRQESHRIKNEVARDCFVRYLITRYGQMAPGVDLAGAVFFDANMRHDDPMPPDINALWEPKDGKPGLSYAERRHLQWDREVEVSCDEAGSAVLRFTAARPPKEPQP